MKAKTVYALAALVFFLHGTYTELSLERTVRHTDQLVLQICETSDAKL